MALFPDLSHSGEGDTTSQHPTPSVSLASRRRHSSPPTPRGIQYPPLAPKFSGPRTTTGSGVRNVDIRFQIRPKQDGGYSKKHSCTNGAI